MNASRSVQAITLVLAIGASVALYNSFIDKTAFAQAAQEQEQENVLISAMYDAPPSIARADLLACEQRQVAKARSPDHINIREFGDLLTGTWVRQVTWHGVPIPTESAIYFDLRRKNAPARGEIRGTGFMFDQSNLGKGPLTRKVEALKDSGEDFYDVPTLTFIDCDYDVRDQYIKISDDFVFEGLEVVTPEEAKPLLSVWKQLVGRGFFDIDSNYLPASLHGKPGAELYAPSRVGVHFSKADLKTHQIGQFYGAQLHLVGQYRGSHAGFKIGDSAKGEETAHFVKEGNTFVSQDWETDCEEFLALPVPVIWERTVLDPGAGKRGAAPSASVTSP